MNIKIYSDREVKQLDYDVYGTQNENNITTLKIEVPEQYENWNKRIVFLTKEGNFWDYIKMQRLSFLPHSTELQWHWFITSRFTPW